MSFRSLTPAFSVSPQLSIADMDKAAAEGFKTVVCARPDDEQAGQLPAYDLKRAAHERGMSFATIPIPSGSIPDEAAVDYMRETLAAASGPVLAYCQGGGRAARLWALAQAGRMPADAILAAGETAGIDLSLLTPFLPPTVEPEPTAEEQAGTAAKTVRVRTRKPAHHFNVVIAGGGAAGLATAASILRRRRGISVVIVEPSASHFYQPGWTLVGGGVFTPEQTKRSEAGLIPPGATWVQQAVAGFMPHQRQVALDDGTLLSYDVLVVATGLMLDWASIPGLAATLGRNGVTSNYRYDLAPYTWRLVQALKRGTALFTQPPMPIKCAGAPQKAMYLACDAWRRRGILNDMRVGFDTATPALFGVAPFVPALMTYIERYGIDLHLRSKLVAVDGERRVATFERTTEEGTTRTDRQFDMLHVVPPQVAPPVVSGSPLAGADGFVAVNPATLRHTGFDDVFALGDVAGTTNAKTAAAVRKQAPVVAVNVLAALDGKPPVATYDGYGACPLTVERGRIVLAEFGYGGRLEPTLPQWLLRGTEPTRLAWFLKEKIMPPLYWNAMLRGHELMVAPRVTQEA
ncbi:bifunctional protein tyrosine phosphatase family protein/NAD(P)/FAD-dependent oxidoreductase [Gluconacetobacter takamatsuzukensis]|uniref:TIGR01244 family phosphatase n=1 Tax=Gluconacetobacter takamatsuzukensis TaxID=1286190 RepID=A0A7W4KE40_9PROT|nr:bifunctional protein tyrosine phosphatase family protein/NAD(P)/FAD-dependent oxidoreductase [Gluconacetobacter takamatsuzukensis]MBB2205288.1 TIGR01244 family phosphatase [Gluconacetobacter takamatsuzukensis]